MSLNKPFGQNWPNLPKVTSASAISPPHLSYSKAAKCQTTITTSTNLTLAKLTKANNGKMEIENFNPNVTLFKVPKLIPDGGVNLASIKTKRRRPLPSPRLNQRISAKELFGNSLSRRRFVEFAVVCKSHTCFVRAKHKAPSENTIGHVVTRSCLSGTLLKWCRAKSYTNIRVEEPVSPGYERMGPWL